MEIQAEELAFGDADLLVDGFDVVLDAVLLEPVPVLLLVLDDLLLPELLVLALLLLVEELCSGHLAQPEEELVVVVGVVVVAGEGVVLGGRVVGERVEVGVVELDVELV